MIILLVIPWATINIILFFSLPLDIPFRTFFNLINLKLNNRITANFKFLLPYSFNSPKEYLIGTLIILEIISAVCLLLIKPLV